MQSEHLHNLVAVDDGLQQPFVVLLHKVGQLLAHHTEVLEEHFLLHLVLAGDVRLAERHQVVDVVARIVQQTAHGRVGHLAVGNHLWSHVQVNQLLHIFHLGTQRQFQPAEDVGHHFRANEVMVVECPSRTRLPAFRLRLAYVVQQGSPTQVE